MLAEATAAVVEVPPPPKKIKVVHVVRAFDVCTSPTLV